MRAHTRHVVSAVAQADRIALVLGAAIDGLAIPLARAADAFSRMRGWCAFGYARLEDHARERFGRTGRWFRDLAALGRAVERLPRLGAALSGGDGGRPIGRVAAVAVGRVATGESVEAWIAHARRHTVREVKAAVAAARRAGASRPDEGVASAAGDGSEPCRDALDDSADERCLVTMLLPRAVLAAFEETLALHRAVCGHEASVTSFVEALVAEAQAGSPPADVQAAALHRAPGVESVEAALARASRLWADLPERGAPQDAAVAVGEPVRADGPACSAALAASARLRELELVSPDATAAELDRRIRALIDLEDELERHLGRVLGAVGAHAGWRRLLFAGAGHYAEQRLGLGRTALRMRVRLDRALRRLPLLREAYDGGRLGMEAASTVVRALGDGPVEGNVERAWVERACEATVKRLRDELRALVRARAFADSRRPLPLTDEQWHRSVGHRPGELRARVHELAGIVVPDDDDDPAAPHAGASDVFLRLRLPDDLAADFLASVESARRTRALEADAVAWDVPWPDASAPASLRAARTFSVRCRRSPAWVGLLALLEDYVDTWDRPEAGPRRPADEVYSRDGWRCSAPGCTSRRNLEDHHVLYRSRGGDAEDPGNRTCLCRFHHARGEHGGLARVRGVAPLQLVWRLGREDVGEWFRNERRVS